MPNYVILYIEYFYERLNTTGRRQEDMNEKKEKWPYLVLTEETVDKLMDEVKKWMDAGYKLQGGVSVAMTRARECGDYAGGELIIIYSQAMVLQDS